MSARAGIFDPWRQSSIPAENETPPRKKQALSTVDDFASLQCVQFSGLRAGIFVWLRAGDEDDSARARALLVDTVHRISTKEGVAKLLQGWGVYLGAPKQPNTVVFVDKAKTMHIVVPVVDEARLIPRAIDNLALALREAAEQYADVRDTLSALKVNPYVK